MGAAERLLRDAWPADVTLGGRFLLRRGRAIVTSAAVYLYDLSGAPPQVHALVGAGPPADRSSLFGSLGVETTTGMLYINRSGCRCGAVKTLGMIDPPASW